MVNSSMDLAVNDFGNDRKEKALGFLKIVVDKMKGPSDKPQNKGCKIDLMTKVIMDDECLKAIKEERKRQRKRKA